MRKIFKVADIRKLEMQVNAGEISYSRMVEIMNEMANKSSVDQSTDEPYCSCDTQFASCDTIKCTDCKYWIQ